MGIGSANKLTNNSLILSKKKKNQCKENRITKKVIFVFFSFAVCFVALL